MSTCILVACMIHTLLFCQVYLCATALSWTTCAPAEVHLEAGPRCNCYLIVITGEFDLADPSCCGNSGSDDPAHGELKKRKASRLLLQDTSLPVSHAGASASRHLLAGCPAPGNNNPDANTLITVSHSAVPASGQCLHCCLH